MGVMMGNDRKTERKTRSTFVLLWDRFLCEGWIRDTSNRGGAGGGESGGTGGGVVGSISLCGGSSEIW